MQYTQPLPVTANLCGIEVERISRPDFQVFQEVRVEELDTTTDPALNVHSL